MQITRAQMEANPCLAIETEPHHFVVEASSLELFPGVYPTRVDTDLGNGRPFYAVRHTDIGGMFYRQEFGCVTLHIVND